MKRLSRLSMALFRPSTCGLLSIATVAALPAHAQLPCVDIPPSFGLVGWWSLDESHGNTVADRTGQNNGTVNGSIGPNSGDSPQSVGGFVGTGLHFSQNNPIKINSSSGNLDFGTGKSFTIDAWIKGGSVNFSTQIVHNSLVGGVGYTLRISSAKLTFDLGNGLGGLTTVTHPTPINPNVWTFVAAVVDRTSQAVTLYIGTTSLTPFMSPPIPSTSDAGEGSAHPVQIGGCPGSSLGCDSVLDEVEIFERALKPPHLKSIVDAGQSGKCVKKGMTWIHAISNAQFGTITVGCGGCDAYQGDTVCSQQLPLLCIYKPLPAFLKPIGLLDGVYNRWSGGVVATTKPFAGNTFLSRADADAACSAEFDGPNPAPGIKWRVAEFHDGAGWNFQAYGGTVSAPNVPSKRFWVHTNTQPSATCWGP